MPEPSPPKPHSAHAAMPTIPPQTRKQPHPPLQRQMSNLALEQPPPMHSHTPDQMITDPSDAPPPKLDNIRQRAEALRKRSAATARLSHESEGDAEENGSRHNPHPPPLVREWKKEKGEVHDRTNYK